MPGSTVIKRLHTTLTVALVLMVAGFGIYQYYISQPPDDVLFSQHPLTPDIYLYITQYKGGGATVRDVYRYYLDGDLKGDILVQLTRRSPFLVADVGNANVTGNNKNITVNVTGYIYTFTSADFFYANGEAVMPVISINATGVR